MRTVSTIAALLLILANSASGQESSSSPERCDFKRLEVGYMKDISGPCYFLRAPPPARSFVTEGFVLRARINFENVWVDSDVHFASCAVIQNGDGAICGITAVDAFDRYIVRPDSLWHKWALQLGRRTGDKFEIVSTGSGDGKWVNLVTRSKTTTSDGRPFVMPIWNKRHLDALEAKTELPPPLRAMVGARR